MENQSPKTLTLPERIKKARKEKEMDRLMGTTKDAIQYTLEKYHGSALPQKESQK
jgi:hypothetical protein